jgi:hypothetical protein
MGRHPLVQLDQLIDLGPRQSTPTFDQRIKAIPGGTVCQHERVDVHVGESRAGRPAR